MLPGFTTSEFIDNVDPERFKTEIAFVFNDGSVIYGPLAFGVSLKTSIFNCVKFFSSLLLDKKVRKISVFLYRKISDNRYKFPGSSCGLLGKF